MNGIWEMNALGIIKAGGPLMAPIILCSIFALGIIIEKIIYFNRIKTDVNQLKKDIIEAIKKNKIKEAIQVCDINPSPVAKILKAGILKFGSSREEIKENIEDVSSFEIPKLENRLAALATIGHITPLLGFLGTVTGMISCFYTIQTRTAAMTPVTSGDLSGGIAEALLTTMAGLLVAIPTYVAYNYFVHCVSRFILEMERAATELVNFMSHAGESHP